MVHCSFNHNGLKLEATQMSIKWWINLKFVLYSSREQTTDAINNIDEPQAHCLEWKKPDTKKWILMIYLDEVQE